MPPRKKTTSSKKPTTPPAPCYSVLPRFTTAQTVQELTGEYIVFHRDHPPNISTDGISLYELNHIFLVLCGCEKLTIEDTLSRVEPRYRPHHASRQYASEDNPSLPSHLKIDYAQDNIDGKYLYSILIAADPSTLFITGDSIEELQIESFDLNNLIKQADKYGDKDGFVGYCDFLNITIQAGLWELASPYPQVL